MGVQSTLSLPNYVPAILFPRGRHIWSNKLIEWLPGRLPKDTLLSLLLVRVQFKKLILDSCCRHRCALAGHLEQAGNATTPNNDKCLHIRTTRCSDLNNPHVCGLVVQRLLSLHKNETGLGPCGVDEPPKPTERR
jgi:hypothetical protein